MFEQAEGVTQGAEQPQVSAQDSTPESIETGAAQHGEVNAEPSVNQPKSKEFNFKQLRENVSRLEAERKEWLAKEQKLQSAAQLEQALLNDPQGTLKVLARNLRIDPKVLFEELQPKSELPPIDFEQYEPETAKLLKFLHDRAAKVEQLEQWKDQFEREIKDNQRQASEKQMSQNMASLEEKFSSALIKDGFLDEKGNGDMEVVEVVRDAVTARLAQFGDPRLATIEQFQDAYAKVSKGLSAHKTKTLQNTVTKNIPSSGSRNGAATTAKPVMTKEQRIAELANASKQMFGFE